MFQAGKSGNPGGRPKEKEFRNALMVAIKRADGDKCELALIAEALVNEAKAGNIQAIREVADRIDGKPEADVNVNHEGTVTFRSAALSALNDLFSEAAGAGADRVNADPLPN